MRRAVRAADAVSRVLGLLTAATAATCGCGWPARKTATYTHRGTAVAFIISELPGGRAEACRSPLHCNGSVGAHGGRAIHKQARAQTACRAGSACETRRLNRRAQ
jgi:hypothetical protein